jgi:RluA family pseudouridine synthase
VIQLEQHTVPQGTGKVRFVDYVIGRFSEFQTRNSVKKGIKSKRLLINGQLANTGIWIKPGDNIEVLQSQIRPKAYQMTIDMRYEDEHLIIVNKPAGLVVSGNRFKTLEHGLIGQIKEPVEDALPWALPVHRLDAPTSGLVIFAKTHAARRSLGEMFEKRKVLKKYHAIVHGQIQEREIAQNVQGKRALSRVHIVSQVPSLKNEYLSLVELEPVTGRTHQLRIHCAQAGHPIVGDSLYARGGTFRNKGLMLAATSLEFQHPISKENLKVAIPMPNKFTSLLKREERRVRTKRD